MYSEQNTLSELLQVEKASQLFEKIAPGMRESANYTYIKDLPFSVVIENSPESAKEAYALLIDAANGKDVDFQQIDPKTQKPEITGSKDISYDIDDIDGQMFMLDHRFGGCVMTQFSKTMESYGKVTCNGVELPKGTILAIKAAGGMQMCGIPVRALCKEYDTNYELLLEHFMDTDGNEMDPVILNVKTLPKPEVDEKYAANDSVALQAAREGIVLLKNENNILPLEPNVSFDLYGADEFRVGAYGAGRINPRYSIGLYRGISDYSKFTLEKDAEIGVVVISRASGENLDNNATKGSYYLTDDEEKLIRKLSEEKKHVIAILSTGHPIDLRWVETYHVESVIWCGFSGMCGGRAVVEILDGRVNPSGKLPDTWSLDYWDIPASKNFFLPASEEEALGADEGIYIDTCYEEGLYVGYRYFETFDKAVSYPFGYGLSYTKFQCEGQIIEDYQVCITVKNTGTKAGKHVVQLYVSIPEGELEQPKYRLIGFAKTTELQSGETIELQIPIQNSELVSFSEKKAAWIMEAGDYEFFIGDNVSNLHSCGTINFEDAVIKQSDHLMMLPMDMDVFTKKKNNFPQGLHTGIKEGQTSLEPKSNRKHYPEENATLGDWVDELTVEQLARLSVCASHGWGMHEKGEAGRIYKLKDSIMPDYVVADGNNGVNVKKKNIGMPCSNTVCATWNAELAYQVGEVIAKEAKEQEINMILAPAMNLHRNPLNGRHPEYFSEDPYLAGIMAGNQSKGLEDNGISCSVKHVIGNNCEASRKCNQSLIPERALRELYLKAFEVAFSVHQPDSIMTGYNAVNGCFTASDEEMLQGIFRKEFGFKGFVMTDWSSYDTAGVVEPVAAGNAWMTPGTVDDTYTAPIVEGVNNGVIDLERLKANVRSMLRVVQKRTHVNLNVK